MSAPIAISRRQVAVSPHNSTNFAEGACEGLWIGVAGTISYIPADQTATGVAIATTVPAGLFPVSAIRVNATGTAAQQIVALY
jgi:hypothetical protein